MPAVAAVAKRPALPRIPLSRIARGKTTRKPFPTVQAKPLTREERHAASMLVAIQKDLAAADFFTREDLLQLAMFQNVATITRYHEVCLCVSVLLRRGELLAKSRTDLCLPERERRYRELPLASIYFKTLKALASEYEAGAVFGAMDLVRKWETDPHLTTNLKRTAARGALKKLASEKIVRAASDFDYLRL